MKNSILKTKQKSGILFKVYRSFLLFLSFQFLERFHLFAFQKLIDATEVFLHLLVAKLVDLGNEAIEEVTVV